MIVVNASLVMNILTAVKVFTTWTCMADSKGEKYHSKFNRSKHATLYYGTCH